MSNSSSYPVDLEFIATESEERLLENEQFRRFLGAYAGNLDPLVHALNFHISARIDCTTCGNCCRSLMINVTPQEANELADRLGCTLTELKQSHVEESMGGQLIINTIPCHFLQDNKCTVYEDRFAECREFPGLHRVGFRDRIFSTLMHYGRCPIVYHLIEELKGITNFIAEKKQHT